MDRVDMRSQVRSATLALVTAVMLAGCGKKPADPTSSSAPADTGATASAAAPAEAPPPPQAAPAIIVNNINTSDTKAAMSAANAALKARQYEDATKLILAMQAQQLSEQQAAAVHNQMIQLQQNLADGIANGDANAQAAAEMLRESSKHGR